MVRPLQSLKAEIDSMSAKELQEIAELAQEHAEKKRLEPLRKEKEKLQDNVANLEAQLDAAKTRLDEVLVELGEKRRVRRRDSRKGKVLGVRDGSLRWFMVQAAKEPNFPKRFEANDLFEAIKGKVRAKSDESLWRQVVATLSRCHEFKNIARGRGVKKGAWVLE